MSTSLLNPVTVEKDGATWILHDSVHLSAFLAKGWTIQPRQEEPETENEPEKPVRRTAKKD